MTRKAYEQPRAEYIQLKHTLSILLDLSAGTGDDGIGDFEDGGEF